MSYYKVCPCCGCHLDPDEICDCDKKEAAASAANTDNGKAGYGMNPQIPASQNIRNFRRFQA